jgi:hypothetical protein
VNALAIDPLTPATLYAGAFGGVFKSTNGAGNWAPADTGLTNPPVYAMAIDPLTPTTLYAAGFGGVFKSTNSAGSWSAFNTGLPPTSVYAIVVNPLTSALVYAGTYGGGAFVFGTSGQGTKRRSQITSQ